MTPDTNHEKPLMLITGGSGLIGTRLTTDFADEFRVLSLDVKEPEETVKGAEFVKCDLTKDESVSSALDRIANEHGNRIASVIHLAAYYDFSGEPSPMYKELTVEGTRRLIQKLQSFETQQFIFSSSLLVMKPVDQEDKKLTEDSATRAEWDYPRSKLVTESLLKEEHGDMPVVILRLAGAYDDACHSLPISQHIRRIYEQKQESFFFPGDADHGQPFIHMDDVVSSFHQAVRRRNDLDDFETFLIAEPDVMSHRELQETLGKLIHGKEWPTIRIPKAAAKAGAWAKEMAAGKEQFIKPWMIDLADDHYPVEIDRARQKLQWEPKHRLRDTLDEMIAGLKEDPKRWYRQNKLPLPEDEKLLQPHRKVRVETGKS